MAKLNDRQKRFVDEYLIDLNATQAAIRAGYSVKTAYSQGQRLLNNVEIKALLRERMKDREKRTEITQDRVLEQLAKIAFSDMKDFMTWATTKQVIDYDEYIEYNDDGEKEVKNTRLLPVVGYVTKIELKDSDEVDGTLIHEVSETNKGGLVTHTLKLNDRMKALELLGKHLGMFTDKVDVTGDLGVRIEVDYGDDE